MNAPLNLMQEIAMGTKRSKAKQKRIDDRMLLDDPVCLFIDPVTGEECDLPANRPGGCRGRCPRHTGTLRRELMNLPQDQQLAIEMRHERDGTLLGNHEVRSYNLLRGAKARKKAARAS